MSTQVSRSQRNTRWCSALWFVAAISTLCVGTPQQACAGDWDFVLAPYVQLPAISGDTSLGPIQDAELDITMGDILDKLSLGGMMQVEAHHRSGLGFILNYGFMVLEDSVDGPLDFTTLDGEVFQGALEAFASHRWQLDSATVDVYGGIRWWEIKMDVSISNPLGKLEGDRSFGWVDPVVGVRFAPQVTDTSRLLLQGDVGGFGIESDSSYMAMAGFLWDMSESYSLALLYKALWVDYEEGEAGERGNFAYDTVTHGPLLGLVIRF